MTVLVRTSDDNLPLREVHDPLISLHLNISRNEIKGNRIWKFRNLTFTSSVPFILFWPLFLFCAAKEIGNP